MPFPQPTFSSENVKHNGRAGRPVLRFVKTSGYSFLSRLLFFWRDRTAVRVGVGRENLTFEPIAKLAIGVMFEPFRFVVNSFGRESDFGDEVRFPQSVRANERLGLVAAFGG